MNRLRHFSVTAACWQWLWLCGCLHAMPSPTVTSGAATGLLHRRRTAVTTTADPLQAAFDRGRVLGSQRQQQQQQQQQHQHQQQQQLRRGSTTSRLRASDGGQTVGPDDQDVSDTIGINFGLGLGLDTPLLDSLLDRLIRRKQMLMAAAGAAYPGINWGVTGGGAGGFFPGATGVLFPYAGGGLGVGLGSGGGGLGGGGGGFPWNRPAAYPVPVPVPAVNPFGGGGGWGTFGSGGLGGGGWGTFGSGFNPLFDFDNDFGFKNNNVRR